MKIYIVTSGEYSSYRIEAVFLDKKKAEEYCSYYTSGWKIFNIEIYETADDFYKAPKKGFLTFEAETDIIDSCFNKCQVKSYLSMDDLTRLAAFKIPGNNNYHVSLIESFPEDEYDEQSAKEKFDKIMRHEFTTIANLAAEGMRVDFIYQEGHNINGGK